MLENYDKKLDWFVVGLIISLALSVGFFVSSAIRLNKAIAEYQEFYIEQAFEPVGQPDLNNSKYEAE